MTQSDPTTELREKHLALTYACPKGRYESHCPFAMLSGLSHNSRESVFDRMNYDELLSLFDLVSSCACPADPRRAKCAQPVTNG